MHVGEEVVHEVVNVFVFHEQRCGLDDFNGAGHEVKAEADDVLHFFNVEFRFDESCPEGLFFVFNRVEFLFFDEGEIVLLFEFFKNCVECFVNMLFWSAEDFDNATNSDGFVHG